MKAWWLLAVGWLLVLAGGALAGAVQTSGGVRISDVRIDAGGGKHLAALLYTPQGATPQTPAPAILAVHGYINSRETQSGFAIEFARRGYVVLALDQSGHGFSDPPAFANAFGGPAALRYLRSLPVVDTNNIGLEGHSMGGWTVLNAAAQLPDGYKAVVLEGSSTGPGMAPRGTTETPRNLGVVFSKYDEFSRIMWGVEKGADVVDSKKLQAVFGTDQRIEPGRVYGSIERGTGRWLATPTTTHPGDHISGEAIGDAIRWFSMTLSGGEPLPPENQIWFWKEIGTLVALVGGVVIALGACGWLLSLPAFSAARRKAEGGVDRMSVMEWLGLAVAIAVPAFSYFPVTAWAAKGFPGSALFPQNITNQIVAWALVNGLASAVFAAARWRSGNEGAILQKIAVALGSAAMVYLAVVVSDLAFKTDFRFWVVALKPMAPHHWAIFAAYLIPVTAFFYASQRAQVATLQPKGANVVAQYAISLAASAGGMLLLIGGVYVALFAQGKLPGTDSLFSVIGMQFVPVLAATAVISTFAWRRTNGPLTGALICGLLVTWYIVAGQATHIG